jgi:hypothetical protein
MAAPAGYTQLGYTGHYMKNSDGSGPYTWSGSAMTFVGAGGGSGTVASDGTTIPVDSLAQVLGYDGSGNLTSVTVVYRGDTYVKTLTYTSGNLTGVSVWVKQ